MAIKTTGALYAWGQNGGGQFGVTTNTGRGSPNEEDNRRSVLTPMEVGTLIDTFSNSGWLFAIAGKNLLTDYDYYYYYVYDTTGARVVPYKSTTLARAIISPNSRKT